MVRDVNTSVTVLTVNATLKVVTVNVTPDTKEKDAQISVLLDITDPNVKKTVESANWAKHAPLSMAPACPVSLAGWEHVAICLVQLDIMERTVHRNVQSVLGKKDVVQRVGPVLTVILGRWDPGVSSFVQLEVMGTDANTCAHSASMESVTQ